MHSNLIERQMAKQETLLQKQCFPKACKLENIVWPSYIPQKRANLKWTIANIVSKILTKHCFLSMFSSKGYSGFADFTGNSNAGKRAEKSSFFKTVLMNVIVQSSKNRFMFVRYILACELHVCMVK